VTGVQTCALPISYVTSLAKATDKYTVGIKQALERGTAM
jgi:hypothetical protein